MSRRVSDASGGLRRGVGMGNPYQRVASAGVLLSVLLAGCTSTHSVTSSAQPADAASSASSGSTHSFASGSNGPVGSDTVGMRPSTAASKPSGSLGAEGVAPGQGPQCPITSSSAVAAAFGGQVRSKKVTTSGVGNPLCLFTLISSNVGAGGTVTTSVDASSSAAQFAALKKTFRGATGVNGLADDAFYVGNTTTMQFRQGPNSVVVQAAMNLRAGTRYAGQIKANLTALSKVIAVQL